jgi:hypothetical protein
MNGPSYHEFVRRNDQFKYGPEVPDPDDPLRPWRRVNGAIFFSRQAGFPNIITYDMGGTSSDVCLVKNLLPMVSSEHQLSGIPIKSLQMEINTVGAGGEASGGWTETGG